MISLIFFLLFAPIGYGVAAEVPTPKPLVVVSMPPYLHMVKTLVGEQVDVISIVPPGADPHSYEPSPKEMQIIGRASLWIRLGDPFDKKAHRLLMSANPELSCLTLLEQNKDAHKHDPHIWLSPVLAKEQAMRIGDSLATLLPEEKKHIAQALEKFLHQLDECDQTLRAHLANKKGRALLLPHPALGYFCQDYDLVQLALEQEEKEPGPKDLLRILAYAKEHPPLCVLVQPHHNNKGIRLIAKELQLDTHFFDPCSEDVIQSFQQLDAILSP